MSNAACHLSQRPQPFLLHHGLLGSAQIIIGLLQGPVELRLMRGQGDVLAELPKELAFPTAESLCLKTGRQDDAENLAFHLQRRGHQRPQAAAGEPSGGNGKSTRLISAS